MKISFLFALIFNVAISQNYQSQFKMLQDNLVLTDWDLKVNGFRVTDNLFLISNQNDYHNLIVSVTEVSVLFKYKVTEKLSALGGAKFDFHKSMNTGRQDIGVSTSLGLQYDYDDNTYFQAVFDYQLKPVNNPYHYNYKLPSSLNLKSGFKF